MPVKEFTDAVNKIKGASILEELHPSEYERGMNLPHHKLTRSKYPYIKTDEYYQARKLFSNRKHIWGAGPAGSGKSETFARAAESLGRTYFKLNMTGHTTDEAFVGGLRSRVDEKTEQAVVYWQKGLLEKAMRFNMDENNNVVGPAAILGIEEISAAPPETLFSLQRVLEPEATISIDGDGGRLVKAHPEFCIAATDNTIGTGDILGGYFGVNQVNFATRDRFNAIMLFDYNVEVEEKVLRTLLTGSKTTYIKPLLTLAKKMRESIAEGSLTFVMSMRRIFSFAENIVLFNDTTDAFRISIYNFIDPAQQGAAGALYQRAFGKTIS